MVLETYLQFNGHCEEAFGFYTGVLGAKIDMVMTHEGSPMADQAPPEWKKKVMHARMSGPGIVLLGTDVPPQHYKSPQGFYVSLGIASAEEATRVFNALAEGGQVIMPIQKTFWTEAFGMLVDRFGIPWMVNCDPNV